MYMHEIENPFINKVENPIYQDYDEIIKQYSENLVVISNTVWGEHTSLKGGIVRYYGDDRKRIINKWGELMNADKKAGYGKCVFTSLYIDRGGIHIHD